MADKQPYIILTHCDPDELAREVNALIEQGYVPHGDLMHWKRFDNFVQAMVLRDKFPAHIDPMYSPFETLLSRIAEQNVSTVLHSDR